MKQLKIVYVLISCFLMGVSFGCKENEIDVRFVNESFITSEDVDFFINANQTVNIIVEGEYGYTGFKNTIKNRGFVYAKTINPELDKGGVKVLANGFQKVKGVLKELPKGVKYYVRGFLERVDGSIYYGNQVEVNTNVNASSDRKIIIKINEPDSECITPNSIIIKAEIVSMLKESPVDFGFEYCGNREFYGSKAVLSHNENGTARIVKYTGIVEKLNPSSKYYLRPYVKYADGEVVRDSVIVEAITKQNRL